jgi:hypothetical protein
MAIAMSLCRDKIDSSRRGELDNAHSGRGLWAVGRVITLLCRLDTVLLPVPLLQNLLGVTLGNGEITDAFREFLRVELP